MGARDDLPTLADADALVASVLREFAAPPPRMSVSEWAERSIILSAKDSAEPGPYRVARTPYAREPMDCLSQHSAVEEVILMWGAQTGKTRVGSNWLGYLVDTNPGPVMIVQPTIDMAKRYSRQRLAPMIEESPQLRRKVRENRSRDDANTTLLKEFAGGFMAVAGANSAAGLRSMPVRDLFLDEVDGYPLDVDGEGDPCALAEARQTTFSRRKRLRTSTPTVRDVSRIEAAYLAADQCLFHVPCPHCGEFQALEWGADKAHGVRWGKRDDGTPDPATVRYVCAHCGGEILEHHKATMLPAGRWVPLAPGAQGGKVRSFKLPSLYAPLGWLTWAEIAEEWHAAMVAKRNGDTSLLRVFINTRLAETYEDAGENTDHHALRRRAEAYHLRTLPWGALLVTMGVDVQGDRLEAYAWAWGRAEESWLIDHTVIYGDPAVPESEPGSPWAALTEWRRMPFLHESGAQLQGTAAAVDSGGHHTDMVYRYAKRHAAEHVIAVKGSSQPARQILGKPSQVEFNHRGKRIAGGAQVWIVGVDTAKHLLHGRLQVQQAGPGFVHFSKDLPGYVFEQITSERIVPRYIKGHIKREWVKPNGKRNEALDCAVYAIAAAWYAGVPRHTEMHWARYESRIRQPDLLQAIEVDPQTEDNPAQSTEPAATQQQAATPAPAPPAPQPAPKPRRPARKTASGWAKRW